MRLSPHLLVSFVALLLPQLACTSLDTWVLKRECLLGEHKADLQRALPKCQNVYAANADDREVNQRLGEIYYSTGQLTSAAFHIERIISRQSSKSGLSSAELAMHNYQLAEIYSQMRQYSKAERHTIIALSIFESQKRLGDVDDCLLMLGYLYTMTGQHSKSVGIYGREVELLRANLRGGDSHRQTNTARLRLAEAFEANGQLTEAVSQIKTVLQNTPVRYEYEESSAHGELSARIADIYTAYAAMLFDAGRNREALDIISRSAAEQERIFSTYSSDASLAKYIKNIQEKDSFIHGFSANHPGYGDLLELSLALSFLHKGRTIEASAQVNLLRKLATKDPILREHLSKIDHQRTAFREQKLRNGMSSTQAEIDQNQLILLENSILRRLPATMQVLAPRLTDIVKQTAMLLPSDSILIDYSVAYMPGHDNLDTSTDSPHYVAYLLTKNSTPIIIDLGEQHTIDEHIRTFLSDIQKTPEEPINVSSHLYRLIMEPLRGSFGNRRRILIIPDGQLNLVPFSSLYDGESYLLDKYQFTYLSSGRDLLVHSILPNGSAPLILANPDLDGVRRLVRGHAATSKHAESLYAQLAPLPPLPGAQREADYLARLLGVSALFGAGASERALRSVHAPWLLHIATHGLFLADGPTAQTDSLFDEDELRLQRSSLSRLPNSEHPTENQRLRTPTQEYPRQAALILAATTGRPSASTDDDGLLTDEEARELDLRGTKLVVLSACESGQGTASISQGVYGLRRAFLVAGAETLLTSLWRVDDHATQELMNRFYDYLLKDHHSRGDALHMAMLQMKKQRSHPYYWAPFILIGQDGPLPAYQAASD